MIKQHKKLFINKRMVINRENINKILNEIKPIEDTNNSDYSFQVFPTSHKLLEE